MNTATLILEFNCHIGDGNFATVWLLPRSYDEDTDYPDNLNKTSEIEGVVKITGPLPLDEASKMVENLEMALLKLEVKVEKDTWADD